MIEAMRVWPDEPFAELIEEAVAGLITKPMELAQAKKSANTLKEIFFMAKVSLTKNFQG